MHPAVDRPIRRIVKSLPRKRQSVLTRLGCSRKRGTTRLVGVVSRERVLDFVKRPEHGARVIDRGFLLSGVLQMNGRDARARLEDR